jgi:hypothetical protein
MPNCPRLEPHFLPQILHTRSPTAPIWDVFNGIESLLEKNIIAKKMKKRLSGWCFYDNLTII